MILYAMLTVDLKNADSKKRDKFDEELKKKNWDKLKLLTTVWSGYFPNVVSIDKAFEITKDNVDKSATAADIKNYDLAVQFGEKKIFTHTK